MRRSQLSRSATAIPSRNRASSLCVPHRRPQRLCASGDAAREAELISGPFFTGQSHGRYGRASEFEAWYLFARYQDRLGARAASLLISLEGRLDRLMQAWLLVAGLACALRIASSPTRGSVDLGTVAPYVLLVLAPFASMVLAMRWFAEGDRIAQPTTRLAIFGRWRSIEAAEARVHPLYGAGGIMVSLLIGMLLNVPMRALEYLAAMPALSGTIPSWLSTLSFLMAFDVVVFTSLYTVAFVAALRRVPLFPRLLGAIWIFDITMQAVTAHVLANAPGVPVGVANALHALLDGNMQKVLISAGVWLPYLLLSKRVNVTYRSRIRA